jgi:23S rRNA (guanosine2251-2'-O)-methyltransferase
MDSQGKISVWIPGLHAVRETLQKGRDRINAIWVREGRRGDRIAEIIRLSKERGIPLLVKSSLDFDEIAPKVNHQGVLAFCDAFPYAELEGLHQISGTGPNTGLLVAADHITDEGNLGALIRTCAFFGVHGLILPKDRSAQVTGKVIKRSAGTHLHMSIARVVNLGRALDSLSRRGFWIIGAAGESPLSLFEFDWIRDIVLVFGNEGMGLSPSIRKKCHELIRIPGSGTVDSLNVSVAAGIILSEVLRQRGIEQVGNSSGHLPQQGL